MDRLGFVTTRVARAASKGRPPSSALRFFRVTVDYPQAVAVLEKP